MGAYSIWLVETGRNPAFPRSQLLSGQHNTGTVCIPNGFVLVKGEGHLAVIDTGFKTDEAGAEDAARYGTFGGRGAEELLPTIDIDPLAVDTVLITHAHWDHMGNLGAFPNAHIYIQAREFTEWLRADSLGAKFRTLAHGISHRDFDELIRRMRLGQVTLVDGSLENVIPDVDLVPTPDTHTWGHQVVAIRSEAGPYVAVGDLIFQFANLEGLDESGAYVPTGQAVGGTERVLEAFDLVAEMLGGETGRIIPVHDLAAYERYASRETVAGLQVAEVALAEGESSRLPV